VFSQTEQRSLVVLPRPQVVECAAAGVSLGEQIQFHGLDVTVAPQDVGCIQVALGEFRMVGVSFAKSAIGLLWKVGRLPSGIGNDRIETSPRNPVNEFDRVGLGVGAAVVAPTYSFNDKDGKRLSPKHPDPKDLCL